MRGFDEKKLEKLIGKGVTMSRAKKDKNSKNNKFLLDIVESLCELEALGSVCNTTGINIYEFESKYVLIVRKLLKNIYGKKISEVILWWIYESITVEGEILPIVDEKGNEHMVETPKELIKYVEKIMK